MDSEIKSEGSNVYSSVPKCIDTFEAMSVDTVETAGTSGIEATNADAVKVLSTDGVKVTCAESINAADTVVTDGKKISNADGVKVASTDGVEVISSDGVKVLCAESIKAADTVVTAGTYGKEAANADGVKVASTDGVEVLSTDGVKVTCAESFKAADGVEISKVFCKDPCDLVIRAELSEDLVKFDYVVRDKWCLLTSFVFLLLGSNKLDKVWTKIDLQSIQDGAYSLYTNQQLFKKLFGAKDLPDVVHWKNESMYIGITHKHRHSMKGYIDTDGPLRTGRSNRLEFCLSVVLAVCNNLIIKIPGCGYFGIHVKDVDNSFYVFQGHCKDVDKIFSCEAQGHCFLAEFISFFKLCEFLSTLATQNTSYPSHNIPIEISGYVIKRVKRRPKRKTTYPLIMVYPTKKYAKTQAKKKSHLKNVLEEKNNLKSAPRFVDIDCSKSTTDSEEVDKSCDINNWDQTNSSRDITAKQSESVFKDAIMGDFSDTMKEKKSFAINDLDEVMDISCDTATTETDIKNRCTDNVTSEVKSSTSVREGLHNESSNTDKDIELDITCEMDLAEIDNESNAIKNRCTGNVTSGIQSSNSVKEGLDNESSDTYKDIELDITCETDSAETDNESSAIKNECTESVTSGVKSSTSVREGLDNESYDTDTELDEVVDISSETDTAETDVKERHVRGNEHLINDENVIQTANLMYIDTDDMWEEDFRQMHVISEADLNTGGNQDGQEEINLVNNAVKCENRLPAPGTTSCEKYGRQTAGHVNNLQHYFQQQQTSVCKIYSEHELSMSLAQNQTSRDMSKHLEEEGTIVANLKHEECLFGGHNVSPTCIFQPKSSQCLPESIGECMKCVPSEMKSMASIDVEDESKAMKPQIIRIPSSTTTLKHLSASPLSTVHLSGSPVITSSPAVNLSGSPVITSLPAMSISGSPVITSLPAVSISGSCMRSSSAVSLSGSPIIRFSPAVNLSGSPVVTTLPNVCLAGSLAVRPLSTVSLSGSPVIRSSPAVRISALSSTVNLPTINMSGSPVIRYLPSVRISASPITKPSPSVWAITSPMTGLLPSVSISESSASVPVSVLKSSVGGLLQTVSTSPTTVTGSVPDVRICSSPVTGSLPTLNISALPVTEPLSSMGISTLLNSESLTHMGTSVLSNSRHLPLLWMFASPVAGPLPSDKSLGFGTLPGMGIISSSVLGPIPAVGIASSVSGPVTGPLPAVGISSSVSGPLPAVGISSSVSGPLRAVGISSTVARPLPAVGIPAPISGPLSTVGISSSASRLIPVVGFLSSVSGPSPALGMSSPVSESLPTVISSSSLFADHLPAEVNLPERDSASAPEIKLSLSTKRSQSDLSEGASSNKKFKYWEHHMDRVIDEKQQLLSPKTTLTTRSEPDTGIISKIENCLASSKCLPTVPYTSLSTSCGPSPVLLVRNVNNMSPLTSISPDSASDISTNIVISPQNFLTPVVTSGISSFPLDCSSTLIKVENPDTLDSSKNMRDTLSHEKFTEKEVLAPCQSSPTVCSIKSECEQTNNWTELVGQECNSRLMLKEETESSNTEIPTAREKGQRPEQKIMGINLSDYSLLKRGSMTYLIRSNLLHAKMKVVDRYSSVFGNPNVSVISCANGCNNSVSQNETTNDKCSLLDNSASKIIQKTTTSETRTLSMTCTSTDVSVTKPTPNTCTSPACTSPTMPVPRTTSMTFISAAMPVIQSSAAFTSLVMSVTKATSMTCTSNANNLPSMSVTKIIPTCASPTMSVVTAIPSSAMFLTTAIPKTNSSPVMSGTSPTMSVTRTTYMANTSATVAETNLLLEACALPVVSVTRTTSEISAVKTSIPVPALNISKKIKISQALGTPFGSITATGTSPTLFSTYRFPPYVSNLSKASPSPVSVTSSPLVGLPKSAVMQNLLPCSTSDTNRVSVTSMPKTVPKIQTKKNTQINSTIQNSLSDEMMYSNPLTVKKLLLSSQHSTVTVGDKTYVFHPVSKSQLDNRFIGNFSKPSAENPDTLGGSKDICVEKSDSLVGNEDTADTTKTSPAIPVIRKTFIACTSPTMSVPRATPMVCTSLAMPLVPRTTSNTCTDSSGDKKVKFEFSVRKDVKNKLLECKSCRVVLAKFPLKKKTIQNKTAIRKAKKINCSNSCKDQFLKKLLHHGDVLSPAMVCGKMMFKQYLLKKRSKNMVNSSDSEAVLEEHLSETSDENLMRKISPFVASFLKSTKLGDLSEVKNTDTENVCFPLNANVTQAPSDTIIMPSIAAVAKIQPQILKLPAPKALPAPKEICETNKVQVKLQTPSLHDAKPRSTGVSTHFPKITRQHIVAEETKSDSKSNSSVLSLATSGFSVANSLTSVAVSTCDSSAMMATPVNVMTPSKFSPKYMLLQTKKGLKLVAENILNELINTNKSNNSHDTLSNRSMPVVLNSHHYNRVPSAISGGFPNPRSSAFNAKIAKLKDTTIMENLPVSKANASIKTSNVSKDKYVRTGGLICNTEAVGTAYILKGIEAAENVNIPNSTEAMETRNTLKGTGAIESTKNTETVETTDIPKGTKATETRNVLKDTGAIAISNACAALKTFNTIVKSEPQTEGYGDEQLTCLPSVTVKVEPENVGYRDQVNNEQSVESEHFDLKRTTGDYTDDGDSRDSKKSRTDFEMKRTEEGNVTEMLGISCAENIKQNFKDDKACNTEGENRKEMPFMNNDTLHKQKIKRLKDKMREKLMLLEELNKSKECKKN